MANVIYYTVVILGAWKLSFSLLHIIEKIGGSYEN